MPEWDGNESSCSCDCGFDIPKGGKLDGLELASPLSVESGGTGATDPQTARKNLGITAENLGITKESLGVSLAGLGIYTGQSSTFNVSAGSPATVNISFPTTFAAPPAIFIAPQFAADSAGAYGLYYYVRAIYPNYAQIRVSTNFESGLSNVTLRWLAIGQ